MKLLITGVTGFTGGHLAKLLVTAGHDVRGLVRQRSLNSVATRNLEDNHVEVVVGDLVDPISLDRACESVELIYHIAATYRQAGQPNSAYWAINVQGTDNLLESARKTGVRRFVHCSTGGVHGHIDRPPANEDAPLAPGDIYQRTKLEAEVLARQFGQVNSLDVVIARPIGIYGPGDTRFLKMFLGIAKGCFPILGSGEVFYHLTYIEDLVEGLKLCGEKTGASGRTYILAGPEYTTLNKLVQLISAELDVPTPRWRFPVWPFWLGGALCELLCVPLKLEPPLYRRRVDFYTKSRAFDSSRAKRELGYAPNVDLRTGIKLTSDWYRQNGWL